MVYEVENESVWIEIDRTLILDISVGDQVTAKGFSDSSYTWTDQDAQFLENNPDARIFLNIERNVDNSFFAAGIKFFPESN
jgi:hypothetical protein